MKKRIPFTGVYNTRPGAVALSGTSGVVGVGIVGLMVVGATTRGSGKDHRLINCFQITETDQMANSKRLYVVDRPGLAAAITPRSGHIGNAIHVWTGQGTGGKIMSAFGNTDFTLYDSTTSKGNGTGKATGITETSISGTPTLTITSSDSFGWYYQDGGTLTKIADADFPGNASRTLAGTFAHLDGYPFVMDSTGRIYNGDLNSVTAWTAASYITANSDPDVGVGVVRHRNTLIGFCRTHFDVFRNAGNPTGSPLARIEELTQRIGCVSADAIVQLRDAVYFAGTTEGANIAVYEYNGGQVKKVSTPELESVMAIVGASNVNLSLLPLFGRHGVAVTISSSTYVYCVEEGAWHEWSSQTPLWHKTAGLQAGSSTVVYAVSKVSTAGKVYVINPASIVYADDSVAYTATIQTTKWDAGTANRKFVSRVDVIGDQQSTSATLNIASYDDDYQTASTPRQVDLSASRPNLTRCGSFRRRSFLLSHVACGARLEALELDFNVGSA
jgi:hypothetical protein